MKRTLTLLATALSIAVQAQLTMTPLGNLDYQALHNSDLSNVWAYTDELGNEYALVGVNGNGGNTGGLSVVDISDPANPVEVFFTPGPTSIWREIKTWGDYAYVTTEASYGLLIVDLSPLPFSTALPTTVFSGVGWDTSHSLFIDENGRLYLHGANRGNGGVIMYDLTIDPMEPVEVGEYDLWYVHDSYARGDTLYAAHISDGFLSIVDVSDPADPVLMGTQNTPSNFTHNVWLDDTGDNLFTTDEVSGAVVGSYNVSDPGDIQWQDQLQSDPGSGTIPHNTYWLNDFLVTSYYTYGVVVYDATYPANLVETEHYDSSPFNGDGFNGAWGTCPFLPSGNIVVSDIETGLWIMAPQYVHACWLEGTVRNSVTTVPINNADITVLASAMQETTSFDGQYATGTVAAGTYDVLFEAVGYVPQTITGVVLQNGVLTIQDADLVPLVPFDFTGQVVDSVDGTGVADAFVTLANPDATYTAQADGNGNFTFSGIFADTYMLTAGQWGWVTDCSFSGAIDALTPPMTVDLAPGWYDDFTFDFGWTENGTASTGTWQIAEPEGTSNGGDQSNPGVDVDVDCGDQAFITGNAGGSAGNDDVDDGFTRLTSPVFDLTAYIDPYLDYASWFYNAGGMGDPNDTLSFRLTNGIDTVLVDEETEADADMSQWVPTSVRILDLLPPTADMRLIVNIADDAPGHIVEGGVDLFRVWEHSTAGMNEVNAAAQWSLMPNPTDGAFTILRGDVRAAVVTIVDARGGIAWRARMTQGSLLADPRLPAGVYAVEVAPEGGVATSRRLVITR